MLSVDKIYNSRYEKDNSIFLSYLTPIRQYQTTLESLKKKHKKAVHFVNASRVYNQYLQIVENSSDDGEPKGSSGVPVLNVLRGKELINCAIIVVRYFGGKLLGIGGLVRAYTQASLNAVEIATLVEFKLLLRQNLNIAFNKIDKVKYLAKRLDVQIISINFNHTAQINTLEITLEGSSENIELLKLNIGI